MKPPDDYKRFYIEFMEQQELRRRRMQTIFTTAGNIIVAAIGIGIVFGVLFLTR